MHGSTCYLCPWYDVKIKLWQKKTPLNVSFNQLILPVNNVLESICAEFYSQIFLSNKLFKIFTKNCYWFQGLIFRNICIYLSHFLFWMSFSHCETVDTLSIQAMFAYLHTTYQYMLPRFGEYACATSLTVHVSPIVHLHVFIQHIMYRWNEQQWHVLWLFNIKQIRKIKLVFNHYFEL